MVDMALCHGCLGIEYSNNGEQERFQHIHYVISLPPTDAPHSEATANCTKRCKCYLLPPLKSFKTEGLSRTGIVEDANSPKATDVCTGNSLSVGKTFVASRERLFSEFHRHCRFASSCNPASELCFFNGLA
eukprot:Gb_15724 [translate_table: standard]